MATTNEDDRQGRRWVMILVVLALVVLVGYLVYASGDSRTVGQKVDDAVQEMSRGGTTTGGAAETTAPDRTTPPDTTPQGGKSGGGTAP